MPHPYHFLSVQPHAFHIAVIAALLTSEINHYWQASDTLLSMLWTPSQALEFLKEATVYPR